MRLNKGNSDQDKASPAAIYLYTHLGRGAFHSARDTKPNRGRQRGSCQSQRKAVEKQPQRLCHFPFPPEHHVQRCSSQPTDGLSSGSVGKGAGHFGERQARQKPIKPVL
ncbi:hypothetical protein DPEC_G00360420 [Dallia pectoralis]|uniref:Uncharacterized protein n=1 Tax=Dallia pectoralis TaxID=75939 RepID=A0ACC2F0R0_DALPE|nr:hypothetical protein DPEC_G00360420 [Dallia pectoralis]